MIVNLLWLVGGVAFVAFVIWLDRDARKAPTETEVRLYLRDSGLEDTEANRARATATLAKGLFRR